VTEYQDSVKKILPAAHFPTPVLPSAHPLNKKSCLRRTFLHEKILSVGHLVSVSGLVYQFTGIENDLNSSTH